MRRDSIVNTSRQPPNLHEVYSPRVAKTFARPRDDRNRKPFALREYYRRISPETPWPVVRRDSTVSTANPATASVRVPKTHTARRQQPCKRIPQTYRAVRLRVTRPYVNYAIEYHFFFFFFCLSHAPTIISIEITVEYVDCAKFLNYRRCIQRNLNHLSR